MNYHEIEKVIFIVFEELEELEKSD